MTKMNEQDVLMNGRSLLAIAGLFGLLSAGCSTQPKPIPLSNITGDTGGQGICVIDGDPFDCTITDVTDGSGYSRIWEISGALNDKPVDALLFANRDGQSWQMDLTHGSTNLISGVDVQAFRSGGMGCLKADEGDRLLCLDRQSPPFADISCRDDGSETLARNLDYCPEHLCVVLLFALCLHLPAEIGCSQVRVFSGNSVLRPHSGDRNSLRDRPFRGPGTWVCRF